MNVKAIARNVGLALLASALFMFLSILVSLSRGNDSALTALIISFIITFTVGIFPFIFVKKAKDISLRDGYMIIFLSWTLSFIFGMLPYLLWGGPFSVVNAWFESVSGYTTAGGTILSDVEMLPDSLLFWRASTHFIGGLGIVVFLLLVIPLSAPVKLRLSNMEISSLSKEGYNARANKTVFLFTYVYLGLAAGSFLCYVLAGMSPFDAICHAFSVCSTGGFSTKNLSIASFNSLPITLTTMLFMFLSSIHFGMLFMVLAMRSLRPLRNPVFKFYVGLLLVSSLLIAFSLRYHGICTSWGSALLDGSFHALSFASTTGFAISDNATWPYFANMVLLVCGFFCGMAGSTTGGIKSDRIVILWNELRRSVRRCVHPSSVSEARIGRSVLKDEEIHPHILYIALYFMLIVVSILLCQLFGADSSNSLMSAMATLGDVGPGMGDLGTFGNYGGEPVAAKMVYTLNMFLGRVEIYPVIAVIYMLTGKRVKLG